MRLLRPRDAAEPVPAPQEIRRLLGDGPLAWIQGVARDTTDLVMRRHPELVDFPWDTVVRSNESSLLEVLTEFAGGRVTFRALNEPRTSAFREVLVHGVELPRALATLRAAQQFWTMILLEHAVAVGASPTVLREIAVAIARGADSVVNAYIRTYPGESERLANTAAARRWRVIEELLADPGLVDPDVARQMLAIEPDDHHLCVVVRALTSGPAQTSDLLATGVTAVEAALARTSRGRRVLVHEPESDERWVWVSGPPAAPGAPPAALRGMPVVAGLRFGAGGRHPGAAGFRRTTLEAREAGQLALRSTATLVLHEDVALVGLLSRDRERAAWFVESCLGPLASRDTQAGVLRETLCAFYTSGMRLADTASALHLHRNTLVNRLHRIEALLGHGVIYRATEMYCALLLLDVYPDLAASRPADR